jgi:plastocyanin
MSNTEATRSILRPSALGAGLAALMLALAACSSASPAESVGGGASEGPVMSHAASEAPGESAGTARCEVTADATAAATVTISGSSFGDEVTISAGEAVTFTNNDSLGHTVTEGTGGQEADDACVDEPIAAGASVTVTFNEPGDYDITCEIHASMQTVIHVQ